MKILPGMTEKLPGSFQLRKRSQADAFKAITVMRTLRKQNVLNPLDAKKTLSIRKLIATGREYSA